jgi:hypothetical protein
MSNADIREVERDKWAHFLDRLSKDHEGKHVSMEAYGPGTNPHRELRSLPLVGITYEPKGDSIEFIFGTEPAQHVSHTVNHPTHIWVRREATGEVLDVRSDDGLTFLLRLSSLS